MIVSCLALDPFFFITFFVRYCSVTTLQQLIFFGEERIRYRRGSSRCFISTGLKNWSVTYDNGCVDEVEMQ